MRFKRLKTAVAIALVVSILILGNIIAFGLIQSSQSNQANTGVPIIVVKSNTAAVQPATTQTQTQTAPVIFHPTIRTRAS